VFALLEGRHRDLAVHVWPRADADGVHVGRLHDFAPVAVDPRDAELLGNALAGLGRTVGDGGELDAFLRLEARDVTATSVLACADEPYADRCGGHGGRW
jgi:hypothetical protein